MIDEQSKADQVKAERDRMAEEIEVLAAQNAWNPVEFAKAVEERVGADERGDWSAFVSYFATRVETEATDLGRNPKFFAGSVVFKLEHPEISKITDESRERVAKEGGE